MVCASATITIMPRRRSSPSASVLVALAGAALVAACRSGDAAPSGPAPAEIAVAWAHALATKPPPPPAHRAALRAHDALEHLVAARRVIATSAAPAGAWRWEEVRRMALERAVHESVPGDIAAARDSRWPI
jgi:hypothetical protein